MRSDAAGCRATYKQIRAHYRGSLHESIDLSLVRRANLSSIELQSDDQSHATTLEEDVGVQQERDKYAFVKWRCK
jgi:hypothetical protein